MAKKVKMWFGKPLKGGETVMKRTLSGLCDVTGIKYNTLKAARANKVVEMVKKIYVVGDQPWEIWKEMIG